MSDKNFSSTFLIQLCKWCGKLVPTANQSKSLVCERCLRILTTANLSDQEIFYSKVLPIKDWFLDH